MQAYPIIARRVRGRYGLSLQVGMLRLRGEDRFALLSASLSMTILLLVVMLSGERAARNATVVRSRSIPAF